MLLLVNSKLKGFRVNHPDLRKYLSNGILEHILGTFLHVCVLEVPSKDWHKYKLQLQK